MENSNSIAHQGWRCIVWICCLALAAAALVRLHVGWGFLPAGVAQPLNAGLLLAGWAAAIRFVLLDTRGRRVWLLVLLAAAVLVIVLPTVALGILISVVALLARRWRPWRYLSSRRRAMGFGLGVLTLVLIQLADGPWTNEDRTGLSAILVRLETWSMWSLVIFWLVSLFQVAIHMRLHFLRLKPKLAISAFLIGVIPLLLLSLLGIMTLYATLGATRGTRVFNTLESWRSMATDGVDLQGALFDTTFVWNTRLPEPPTAAEHGAAAVRIPAPDWTADLADRLSKAMKPGGMSGGSADDFSLTHPDTTAWFLMEKKLWLIRWQDLATSEPKAQGWLLDQKPLGILSEFLNAGIDLSPMRSDRNEDGGMNLGSATEEQKERFPGLRASYRDVSGDGGFWEQDLHFGGMLFPVLTSLEPGLGVEYLFLNLKVQWQDLRRDFVGGDGGLNIVIVFVLAVMVGLFLVLEIFAFFFGSRISGGIVAAVQALHRGTRQVAAGDLDTVIDIPNEDEFGDLAVSFNEMTTAVKKGREDALARERLTRELETAREIQMRLLPGEEPRVAGFEITGASIPSREVGGDYFDFIIQPDNRIGIAIGDVSGKGMPAALLMSNLQASLQGQVIHPSQVSEIVQRVNDLMVASTDPHMFATFFYGELDLASGAFTCTNAGHNPPLVLRRSGEIDTLGLGGLLLGMVSGMPYQQETIDLAPGEVILLYTDGITEAVGPDVAEDDPESMFGEEALYEVLRQSKDLPAVGIKEAVLAAVAGHTSGAVQSDDITLVVIRRLDGAL